jgi:CBS domain-containing protein
VLWLMARAGYIGRDVAPLGAEPPAEAPAEEDEEPEEPAAGQTAPTPPGDPVRDGPPVYHSRMKLASLLVSDYMTENPLTLEPEEPLMRALEIIRLRGVRRLPVAVGGMLVGLITEGDIKRAEPSTLTDSQEDFTRVMEGTPISRIMISKPVTTTADTPLMEAAEIMLNTKYGALPVVAGGRVIGILTDNDLTRALVDLMREAKEAKG